MWNLRFHESAHSQVSVSRRDLIGIDTIEHFINDGWQRGSTTLHEWGKRGSLTTQLRRRAPWAGRATKALRDRMGGGRRQSRLNAHASLSNLKEQS